MSVGYCSFKKINDFDTNFNFSVGYLREKKISIFFQQKNKNNPG